MDLQCAIQLAAAYKSRSQIARVLTEDWCQRELYCVACDSPRLSRERTNTPALDFRYPGCGEGFQLKSFSHLNSPASWMAPTPRWFVLSVQIRHRTPYSCSILPPGSCKT
ncbi:MAG: hypothetical protein H0X25_17790 [Acidobacteriales bacterium]|nr:hypothetical protein [Terriglobales bacterium]